MIAQISYETSVSTRTNNDPLQEQAAAYSAGYAAYMAGQALAVCSDEDMRLGWRSARRGEMACDVADTAVELGHDIDAALAYYAWGDPPSIEDDCTPSPHPMPY